MNLVLVMPPIAEPVSLDQAKLHLRVDTNADDVLIGNLIAAARQLIEGFTGRALITQTWNYVLDAFPSGAIRVPRPPLQEVISIKYRLEDETEVVLDEDDYLVDTGAEPALIVPASGKSWPSDKLSPINGVVVGYDAGYGIAADDVPMAIRQAILLTIGHWYEHRESVIIGQTTTMLPLAAESLLWLYRTWWSQP